ncbi:MAG: prealbumin-like fold domain-containing protein, partial [Clostridium paraputrificum]
SDDDHICNDCKEEESVKQEPCNVNTSEYYEEYESQKWLNCEDEWTENNNCGYSVKDKKDKCKKEVKGVITVISALHSKEGTKIKGVKVNLYKLNGICPELVDSKVTDCDGKVVFCNIPEGAYRVIELIDKRYFEKPQYINWNEVTIDECTTESCIYIINKIKNQRKCRR